MTEMPSVAEERQRSESVVREIEKKSISNLSFKHFYSAERAQPHVHTVATNFLHFIMQHISFLRSRHLSLIAFLCLLFGIGTCPRKSSDTTPPSFQREGKREREKEELYVCV